MCSAQCGKTRNLLSLKNYFVKSTIYIFSDFFSKCVGFTKFLPIKRESKFLPHCVSVPYLRISFRWYVSSQTLDVSIFRSLPFDKCAEQRKLWHNFIRSPIANHYHKSTHQFNFFSSRMQTFQQKP